MEKPVPLSDDHRRALAAVLDGFIPRSGDGALPGAGELGIAADLDDALQKEPAMHAQLVASLAALDRLAAGRGRPRFTALSPDEQAGALNELACSADAFPALLLPWVFGCYYKHPRVLAHYGFEARAPHPKGYDVEPTDLSLLDPVRARGPIYRRC